MAIKVSEIVQNLPDDPILALGVIVNRVDGHTAKGISEETAKIATIVIVKVSDRLDVPLKTLPAKDGDSWMLKYRHYSRQIRNLVDQRETELTEGAVDAELDRMLSERANEPGFAILTADEKAAILQRLETIRHLIEGSGLLTPKKNALFKKLNQFSEEVMRDGTKTDALFAFLGELALTTGVMAKNAKPAIDEAKEITRIVVGSRARREGISLPSPEDILRLPDMTDE